MAGGPVVAEEVRYVHKHDENGGFRLGVVTGALMVTRPNRKGLCLRIQWCDQQNPNEASEVAIPIALAVGKIMTMNDVAGDVFKMDPELFGEPDPVQDSGASPLPDGIPPGPIDEDGTSGVNIP